MQQQINIKVLPSVASASDSLKASIASSLSINQEHITGYNILKRSLDARGRQQWILLTLKVYINEPYQQRTIARLNLPDVGKSSHRVIVVGAGPAGLFAAIKLIEAGIQPVILERGKDVRARRRDLAILNKQGVLNPESNYCFGEGGAGTYSDGKLYTRSTKRGDVNRILNILVQFGAEENILFEAHPHIGTNKLPQIITAMREQIISSGGIVHFEKKLTDLLVSGDELTGVVCSDGEKIMAEAVILATGHSARDIFTMLHRKKIDIEFKPYALGVRVEHPQSLIDTIQYHCTTRNEYLPPASYSLVQQVQNRGVFSFCMCPGGIIAPASTNLNELVVNGWSPSKRNNPFANSGMVVTVQHEDIADLIEKYGPLAGMYFQQEVEKKAYKSGGGAFVAPAQRMVDFFDRKLSDSIPENSYLPGLQSSLLDEVLPPFIYNSLRMALMESGKKMKGYFTNDAVVVATESRTSSPVRIPRDKETLQHTQIKRLYPCAEGAGYAGGIVSAAIDGERVAEQIILRIHGALTNSKTANLS